MSFSTLFYEPFYTSDDFNRLFDNALASRASNSQPQRQVTSSRSKVLTPRMDIHESTKSNTITATFELPGLSKSDVQIDVQHGRLTVSGETSQKTDVEEASYAIRERHFGKFARTLQLPQDIKAEDIKASMENGVLTVVFPRSVPQSGPQRVSIA